MQHKKNLKAIHAKLKQWCDDNGDDELETLVSQLNEEVSTMDEDEGNGNNPPHKPKNP